MPRPRPPRTLAELRAHPWVAEVWQENDGCFDSSRPSWWVTLRDGWRYQETSTIHEPTLRDVFACFPGIYHEMDGRRHEVEACWAETIASVEYTSSPDTVRRVRQIIDRLRAEYGWND